MTTTRTHLDDLEAEAIYVLREVAAQFEHPAILFSGGKDSIVVLHLAKKAFWPAPIPMPVVHIDTGHNFEETISYRDALVESMGLTLIVGSVEQSIAEGKVAEEKGYQASRNTLQTQTLLDSIAQFRIDAAIGGARRDEEKARAKERFFSHRDEFGQWDPRNQRPELWSLYNGRKQPGEHFRVFPISNWTELDVWQYIQRENIPLPNLYLAHERSVFWRNNTLLADSDYIPRMKEEVPFTAMVRCRTIGDITCTGLWQSTASTIEEVIAEIIHSQYTERGGRADDQRSETSMEDRKREGYF